ncbi:uncharacterized protein LOC122280471 [Carya illinoinensis]|uniref:Uncharacterized protein n=1 Tax=Carya illinoinensis TaxID=32201 RepID=A0A8T1NXP3_CARIL|nr:uncharacterized protein LOC122280471 [Carya illinoinensis]KAG6635205.1 hypothetical protein CIPAW_11G026300 [Carya illinoinensis]
MQGGSVVSLSPSFNSYSPGKLAEIAARVVEELRHEADSDTNIFPWATENPPISSRVISNAEPPQRQQEEDMSNNNGEDEDGYEDEDDDFEFAFVCREPDSSPISADEIFYNGQIRPIYPIFDQSLLVNDSRTSTDSSNTSKLRRLPLRKLMTEEREREEAREPASCSSSEADELDGIPAGSYCVWAPTKPPADVAPSSPSNCKKSNSTGSSKRWKFRDLLYRSNSDGKDTFVFLTQSKKTAVKKTDEASPESGKKGNALKEGDKRSLPYRKDLVGFFSNVNGLSRSLQPF